MRHSLRTILFNADHVSHFNMGALFPGPRAWGLRPGSSLQEKQSASRALHRQLSLEISLRTPIQSVSVSYTFFNDHFHRKCQGKRYWCMHGRLGLLTKLLTVECSGTL